MPILWLPLSLYLLLALWRLSSYLARALESRTRQFLRAVRGRLNPMRKRMVRQIFDALDGINGPDGTKGYLTVANIQPIYSVSNHPQVIAGKMTKQEALQEHGNRDGKITLDEWFKYYEELSCSIDKDGTQT
jgi:hypothetical protein